jgi:hypothetical protein
LPKDGEGCYLAPVDEGEAQSEKYLKLKMLIGGEHFRDTLPPDFHHPSHPDVQIEELEEEEAVDIDIDPENINDEEVEVIKALYDEKDYEEIDDDFIQQANLDEVLQEYDENLEEKEEPIIKVSRSELEAALNEFITEHKPLFNQENPKIFEFEGIPFEQDHVLKAALDKSSDSEKELEESSESQEEDDVISNASHFTNTDNRPEVISVRTSGRTSKKIVKKEENKELESKKISGRRERNETKEEKKIRKEKIKNERKEAREEKKKKKEEVKVEKAKEVKRGVGNYDVRQGTSVIKLN